MFVYILYLRCEDAIFAILYMSPSITNMNEVNDCAHRAVINTQL